VLVGTVQQFVSTNPVVKDWHSTISRKRTSTADLYAQSLHTYWLYSVKSRGFAAISQWITEVKEQQRSDDVKVRRQWATDLLNFFDTYKSPRTKRPLITETRNVFVAAIKGFLVHHLGDIQEPSKWILSTDEQKQAEDLAKELVEPLSLDEVKRLYKECKTARDRAIFLTLINGCGISEFLQFADKWHDYYTPIKAKSIPVKVLIQRKKTGIIHNTYLFDDCVDSLADLTAERERELGRPLTANDHLFIIKNDGPALKDDNVFALIRSIADSSGVEPYEKGKVSFRVRPHEIGRDTFKTQCALARIPNDVSEYLLGHKIDKLEYNKFHKTPEGQQIILQSVEKLRPILNIVTGRGPEPETSLRECCMMAANLAVQLKISDEEAHKRILNSCLKNHKDLYSDLTQRAVAKAQVTEAKYGEDIKGHWGVLPQLKHNEAVMLAVEVAMVGQSNGVSYEVKKVAATDEDAYAQAVAEGYQEAGRVNGTIILRRQKEVN